MTQVGKAQLLLNKFEKKRKEIVIISQTMETLINNNGNSTKQGPRTQHTTIVHRRFPSDRSHTETSYQSFIGAVLHAHTKL